MLILSSSRISIKFFGYGFDLCIYLTESSTESNVIHARLHQVFESIPCAAKLAYMSLLLFIQGNSKASLFIRCSMPNRIRTLERVVTKRQTKFKELIVPALCADFRKLWVDKGNVLSTHAKCCCSTCNPSDRSATPEGPADVDETVGFVSFCFFTALSVGFTSSASLSFSRFMVIPCSSNRPPVELCKGR